MKSTKKTSKDTMTSKELARFVNWLMVRAAYNAKYTMSFDSALDAYLDDIKARVKLAALEKLRCTK